MRMASGERAIAGALVAAGASLAAAGLTAAPARAEFVRTAQSDPVSGLHRETWRDDAIPARVHLVRVDLTSAEIVLAATKEAERGRKTTQLAAALNAELAINGGPFHVSGFVPRGLAMGGGAVWSNTADDAAMSVLHFRRAGEQTVAAIIPPEEIIDPAALPAGTQGALSGRPLLVRAGVAVAPPTCNDPIAIPCTRAPRTAAGVSADGRVLWLAVVDGWQLASRGVTAGELGAFLAARGAHMALNLDGGGAATLVNRAGVVNAPSDGVERAVANHLAVLHGALPPGQLLGFICKDTFSPCNTPLGDAVVTLDDGRTRTTGADGMYSFLNVTPRLACATARRAGYRTNSRCSYVAPGAAQYNSIALTAGVDPPDAGVPDAGVPTDPPGDAGPGGPGAPGGPDGGLEPSDGAGCCDARDESPPIALLVLVVGVAFRVARPRGTKRLR